MRDFFRFLVYLDIEKTMVKFISAGRSFWSVCTFLIILVNTILKYVGKVIKVQIQIIICI